MPLVARSTLLLWTALVHAAAPSPATGSETDASAPPEAPPGPTALEPAPETDASAPPEAASPSLGPRADEPAPDEPASRTAKLERVRLARLKRSYQQRTLNHLPMVRPLLTPFAIPTSYLTLQLGGGAVISESVNSSAGEPSTHYYAAGVGRVELGVRAGELVGVGGSLSGIAGVGGTPEAAANTGASALYQWRLHTVVRVLRRDDMALSLGPELHGEVGRGVVLRPAYEFAVAKVAEAINSGLDPDELALEPGELEAVARQSIRRTSALGGGARLAYAYGVIANLGVQLAISGGGVRDVLRIETDAPQTIRQVTGYLRPGLALDVDAGRVPLAIMIEYATNMRFGTGDERGEVNAGHDLGLAVYFNGLTQTLGVATGAELASGRTVLYALAVVNMFF